jgi:hypothetical protein
MHRAGDDGPCGNQHDEYTVAPRSGEATTNRRTA